MDAGAERARGLLAVVGSDADNVYITLTARELNPNLLIIARSTDESSERKLIRAGEPTKLSHRIKWGQLEWFRPFSAPQ